MKKYINIRQIFSFAATFGIPLLYLYNLAIIYRFSNTLLLPLPIILLGLIMAFIGIQLWAISFITLGRAKAFGVLPQKQKRIRKGIYRYFSHPMYVGIWLMFIGLSLADQSKAGLLFTNIVMLPLLIIRALAEEKLLYD